MQQLSASAIVLEVRDLGERDRVVSFLTADQGKKSGAARGARGKFSRFAGQLQPLARVQIAWFEKENRDLVRIQDASVERAFAPGDALESLLVGTYLADLVGTFAQENEDSGPLFRLLDLAATRLAEGVDPELISRYVEIWTLRLAGIFPPPAFCPSCDRGFADGAFAEGGALVDHDAALVCADCAGPADDRVPAAVIEAVLAANGMHLDAWMPRVDASVARQLEKLSTRIRRAFLGHELRAYRVMRQTLRAV